MQYNGFRFCSGSAGGNPEDVLPILKHRVSVGRVPLPWRAALALAALALASGAGLLTYFIAAVALPVGIGIALAFTGAMALGVWHRLPLSARKEAMRRARVGSLAGLAATAAYDVIRWFVVWVFGLSVWPFAALPLFGQLLVGNALAGKLQLAAGIGYHLANGVTFAIAYALVAGERGGFWGVAWALCLECAMLAFYPGWLDVRARGEFFSMTFLGHIAYGSTLGTACRRWLRVESSV